MQLDTLKPRITGPDFSKCLELQCQPGKRPQPCPPLPCPPLPFLGQGGCGLGNTPFKFIPLPEPQLIQDKTALEAAWWKFLA